MGINFPPETQIVHLLNNIRRMLLYWSSKKLSFVGHFIVVNQVILSTMFSVTSFWIFVKSAITQIQRLIRNFLCSRGEGSVAKAKVALSTLILPKSEGGLGLIDPEIQIKAMLAKLVVREQLPGAETWKILLRFPLLGLVLEKVGHGNHDLDGHFLRVGKPRYLKHGKTCSSTH